MKVTKSPSSSAQPSKELPPVSVRELTELLVRHYGLTEGRWVLGMNFVVKTGNLEVETGQRLPGVLTSINAFALARVTGDGPEVVDAALVNPRGRRSDA
jgi:hypothetical protein